MTSIYATPVTFMDMLLKCSQYMEEARNDPGQSTEDVLYILESRLSLLMGKLVAHPTCTSFTVFKGGQDE
jgi:hypothetical protein